MHDFLLDAMAIDPARLIAAWRKPVLIVQGGRDLQVSVADAERLEAAAPQAEVALFPDVNHVLKAVATADRQVNMRTYADAGLPLAPVSWRRSPASSRRMAKIVDLAGQIDFYVSAV